MISCSPTDTLVGNGWPQDIRTAGAQLRRKSFSVVEIARHFLMGIRELEPSLNAFITITEREALASATKLDRELASGFDRGPLHGIPIVHKDNLDTAGVLTTQGSDLFRTRLPTDDAVVVAALEKAGAITLGKTNMNELAAGPSGTNKAFGDTHNPWNLMRSAGGSSSGTGAAIAAGLALGGTGTDTGGSIRIPASYCGICGLRPSFGRVDLSGVYPRAYSLDCVGPLAHTVADLAILLKGMTSQGSAALATQNNTETLSQHAMNGLRIGIIENYTFRHIDDDVANLVEEAIKTLQKLGVKITTISIPLLSGALDYRAVFDVLLFEFSEILEKQYAATPDRENVFGPIVQSDLMRASSISRSAYEAAMELRSSQIEEVRKAFSEVDVLITPTMTSVAPILTTQLLEFDRGRQFTLPFGYLKLPALSIPCGLGIHNMPVGLQLVADHWKEGLLLEVGQGYQTVTNHHCQRPQVYWNG